MVSQEVT